MTLEGDTAPGASTVLTTRIELDGEPVTDLEPYLGAYGHLVAMRAGDLGYLHVHPEEGRPARASTSRRRSPSRRRTACSWTSSTAAGAHRGVHGRVGRGPAADSARLRRRRACGGGDHDH